MYHTDDDLDQALLALPLEPLPDGLRASILASLTMAPGAVLTRWEVFGVGLILALATWLSLLLVGGGVNAGAWMASAVGALGNALTSPATLTWMAVGVGCALCLSLVSIPRRVTARR
jgi:hypothetical protein